MAMDLTIVIRAINEASGVINDTAEALRRLQSQENRNSAGGNLLEMGDRLTQIGQGFDQSFGEPARQALMASVGGAIEFESAMADVSKVLGLSSEETAAMGNELMAMSRYLPISADGLASIAAAGGSLGIPAASISDFVELTGQMGTAFDMTADQSGNAIARMINVFSLMDAEGNPDLQGVAQLGDVINRLSDTSAATSGDIVNAMTRVGGVTRQFGLANEEAAALTGAFIAMGRPPEVAATAINSLLPALQTATSGTDKFQAGLAMIGMSAQEMETAVEQDAAGAVQTLFSRLGELDATTRATAIRNMFGSGSDSAIIASLAEDAGVLTRSLETAREAMESPENSMFAEFEKRSATTANSFQLLQNAIGEMGIAIGNAVLPAVNALISAFTPLIQGITQFVAANPLIGAIAAGFLAIVAVIGPIIIGIGALLGILGAAFAAFSAGGAIAVIGTVLSGAFAAITAAAWPIIGIIALIAAGAALIIANWASIKSFFSGFAEGLFAGLQPAIATFGTALSAVGTLLAPIVTWIGGLFNSSNQAAAGVNNLGMAFGLMVGGVISSFINLPMNIALIFQSIGAIVMSWVAQFLMFFANMGLSLHMIFLNIQFFIQGIIASLGATISGLAASIGGAIAGVMATVSSIAGVIAGVIAGIMSTVTGAISTVIAGITGGAAQAVAAVTSMGSQMLAAITGIAAQMFAAGVNIVTSIAQGIQSAVGQVTAAISNIASAVRGALPFSPPEYGPLSDIMSVGGNIVHSITAGMTPGPVSSAMQAMLAPAASMMGAPMGGGMMGAPSMAGAGAGGGGGTVIHFSPSITIGGGQGETTEGSIINALRQYEGELYNMVERGKQQASRINYRRTR